MKKNELLRRIPKVDVLLESDALAPLLATHRRPRVVAELRRTLDELRRAVQNDRLDTAGFAPEAIAERLAERLAEHARPYYRRVINATGIILHTGLGRAPLPTAAVDALTTAAYPQRVEIDLESGERGGRDAGCARLLTELCGAEAATVVNNNAGATLLVLAALARGKGVVLSRGEMVEIGGSYRVPEILRESGARLVEVGTTNRTHERDYAAAFTGKMEAGEEIGLVLKVHTSNYRVVGFTSEVAIGRLAEIGHARGVPVVHDLGSGCLVDLDAHGRPGEQRVRDSLAAGADLVCFSGDKLLGGPQAGILVGSRDAVSRCRRHPLYRALRPGRLVYTALEATLRHYLDDEETARREIPALSRLTATQEELRPRAEKLAARLDSLESIEVTAEPCFSQAGSGSLPAREIASWGVRLSPRRESAARLAARLRQGEPPILPRVTDGVVLLDVRTLEADAFDLVAERLRQIDAVPQRRDSPRG